MDRKTRERLRKEAEDKMSKDRAARFGRVALALMQRGAKKKQERLKAQKQKKVEWFGEEEGNVVVDFIRNFKPENAEGTKERE